MCREIRSDLEYKLAVKIWFLKADVANWQNRVRLQNSFVPVLITAANNSRGAKAATSGTSGVTKDNDNEPEPLGAPVAVAAASAQSATRSWADMSLLSDEATATLSHDRANATTQPVGATVPLYLSSDRGSTNGIGGFSS